MDDPRGEKGQLIGKGGLKPVRSRPIVSPERFKSCRRRFVWRAAYRASAVRQYRRHSTHRTDLRFALDRESYGNILALTQEVGHYLSSVLDLLDTPDIKKSFDANTKWDVIEIVSNRHLGGARELSQRTKMAESGRRVLQYIADNEFKTGVNPVNFQLETQAVGSHAEAWIAAYRLTPKKGLSALTGLRCSRIQPASGASIAANGLASDINSYCSRIGCRRCIHSAIGGGSPDPDAAIGAPNASAPQ